MRPSFRPTLMLGLITILTACGGGGNSSSTASTGNSTTTAASTPAVVPNGSTLTMTQNSSVLVPSGTTVSSPNGSIVTISGTSNTVYTQVGATVSVPANATGPANNLVSTGQATNGALATTPATVSVIAGSATTNLAPVDGSGASAIFWGGGHLALDSSGNIIASDRGALRKVTQAGVVTTLVPGYQPADWEGLAIDSSGNIYGAGSSAQLVSSPPATWGASIYQLPVTGAIKGIALNWETSTTNPSIGWGGLAVDGNGNLYLADGPNNRIVKFTATGVMSVFAGSGTSGGGDGIGTAATLNNPTDLAIDANGNLYFTDSSTNQGKSTIRKITADGTVSSIATLGQPGIPIAVDPSGKIYTTDGFSNIVRVDSKGSVTTFNTGITSGFITSIAADANGNLYVGTRGLGAQILKISF
ncbi:Sugar lactone lactonase YvrE [Collimonas sp. OK242]|nr:Sugar lactone lactonase YvrE [Collimonas sp. OK242]